jgi:hypothetical protein
LISSCAFGTLKLKTMINPREWLRTRKNLLEQVKTQVQMRLGPLPESLRRYAKSLDADFKTGWRPGTTTEIERALCRARVALSADFHAYAQSQRAHLRLLRDHVGEKPVVLALECLAPTHEPKAAKFLSGGLSEEEFLTAVEWDKNWGFPWEGYRPLFELARDRGFTVRAIGRPQLSNLPKRDAWTADRLTHLAEEFPQALVFAVIGEWHLAEAHLPRRLRAHRSLKAPGAVVVFHQDVEQLYFKLAQKNKESAVDVLKASRDRFCLMVSPPWMKWQSYLMYLEHTYDRDLQEGLAIDYSDHVASLIEVLEKDLGVEITKTHIQVYGPSTNSPAARRSLRLSRKHEKILLYHFERDLSFFLPQRSWLYLSRPTINHASALAGQFVHAQLCARRRALWDLPTDFLPLIWVEAVGFFFSKWINPKRKAETLESIRLQLAAQRPRDRGRKALLLALDHRLSEVLWARTGRLRPPRFHPRDTTAYLDATRILGGMLGERLFQKVRSRTISLRKLMSYLRVNVDGPDFAKLYWQIVREIDHDQSL